MAYSDPDPELVLRRLGVAYRDAGREFEATCPYCGKEKHFYLNREKGVWKCQKCDKSGNLYQLQKDHGLLDTVQRAGGAGVGAGAEPKKVAPAPPIPKDRVAKGMAALAADPEAMEYLHDRGFTDDWIKAMSLMLERWSFGGHPPARWIGFPWRVKGAYRGIKWRQLPKDMTFINVGGRQKPVMPRFRREKGYESVLYNGDVLRLKVKGKLLDQMIVASGETDALALLSMGYRSVIATTIGEKPFPDEWVKQLEHLRRVFILYDNDQVGREKARALAQKLGPGRSFIVQLPDEINDANELLVKLGPERAKFMLDDRLKRARRPEVPTVYLAVDLADALRKSFVEQDQLGGDYTPWRPLNENLSSFNGLIIVGAPQNVGKTTFCLNIANYWATQNRPALFYCLEMTPTELVSKVMMANYEMNLTQIKNDYAGVFQRFRQEYAETPLYIGYTSERKPAILLDTLKAAVERYELQLLFFDNVHILGRGGDRRYEISEFSAGVKDLSMKLGIPIVLVAQPRKLEHGQVMTNWDFRETGDLISDADQIFILHRQQIGSTKDTDVMSEKEGDRALLSPYTLVRISKARFGGGKDIILFMEGEQHRFRTLRQGEFAEYRGKRGAWKKGRGEETIEPIQDDLPDWVTSEEL